MPFYQRLGDLPRKRHVQFRENGTLLTEEVMGLEGFTGNESILYHLQSPCRVMELAGFEPIERDEWVPDQHAHRHFHTHDVEPEGDEITGRRTLMWNDDVEISLCRPTERMDYFFRNGEGDEVIFVHEGSGTLETIFGDVPYASGDYVVIPRGTTYRFAPDGSEQRYLVFETPGLIEIPKRYRNQYGMLVEGAPYYHRDIHPPATLNTVREKGEFPVKVRVRGGYQTYVLDYHPFDVVGWDGYLGSRRGVDVGSITLHPSGLPHGPQPGLAEKALGMHETTELAVMCDTFFPLKLSTFARDLDDGRYAYSWYENAEGAGVDDAS